MGEREEIKTALLDGLTDSQREAVGSDNNRVLVVAGAGSGKTEVMARRVAWWVAGGVDRSKIVAFTFTERAAEEMKFRVRRHMQHITGADEDATLGDMYVGTIHGFCLKMLRELAPDDYHNYDVIDEAGRYALVQSAYHPVLGLSEFQAALGKGQYAAMDQFLLAYDLLNEYGELEVELASEEIPEQVGRERDWCKGARLLTNVGEEPVAEAFESSAARYYAYLRCRRFLDFSTSQTELLRLLRRSAEVHELLRERLTHVVVDEVQDINPVQDRIIREILGGGGALTAVGDHRQAVYAWRGGRVELMAALYEEMRSDPENARVVDLAENFRSSPRIVDISNRWAATIDPVRSMTSPDMLAGNGGRVDADPSHVATLSFDGHAAEAEWIADKVAELVREDGTGAFHDTRHEGDRGLAYSDIAVLLRTSTDARTYVKALERRGIPAVFRAGPDLFSQPEVLLMLGALAEAAGIDRFFGADFDPRSLPNRVNSVLGCDPEPEPVVRASCRVLREAGLSLEEDVADRLLLAARLIRTKTAGETVGGEAKASLKTPPLKQWLSGGNAPRRVFPQALYHYLMGEAGVGEWDSQSGRGGAAMFHLGQLSSLVTGLETPGWVTVGDFKYRVISLCLWGAKNARAEAPLLVEPDAVNVGTIHGAKGLEYAAVFLADVKSNRFPNNRAKVPPKLPFDGPILDRLDPGGLADNDNRDGERRLMYVAITRAERYLAVTSSQPSPFFKPLAKQVEGAGGTADAEPESALTNLRYLDTRRDREDVRLVTSFSDLRYYLECPHDFYLRKVLGFAPTIDQAFGYGRGVHNLMRAVHADPKGWAAMAEDWEVLRARLEELIGRGLFYLRYTTGEPMRLMQNKAKEIVADYVNSYAEELNRLEFEPEREFETLIEEEQVLVSGAMDVVRLDDPPRVTLIDFKSGNPDSDQKNRLDEREMRLQVGLYGLAARHELEYEPERGLVRYLGADSGERRELSADLDAEALAETREVIVGAARNIRERRFDLGPEQKSHDTPHTRCGGCDFLEVCGRPEAKRYRSSRS